MKLDEEVAETFYHCMSCKRYETWCKHDNDVPQAMFQARAWARDRGFVPEAIDDFVEFFMEANSPHPESAALSEFPKINSAESIFDFRSRIMFMPDCETRHHSPELVLRAGKLLHAVLGYKVRLFTKMDGQDFSCCGFPLLAAGDENAYAIHREAMLEALGPVDFLITDCAASIALFQDGGSFGRGNGSEHGVGLNIKHLIAFLAELIDELPVVQKVDGAGVMLHDSCFVGRHLDLYEETRALANAVLEGFAEFQFNRADTPCCGRPAHYHVVAPAASERCAKERLEHLDREGGSRVICGSATCKKAFRRVRDNAVSADLLEVIYDACGV